MELDIYRARFGVRRDGYWGWCRLLNKNNISSILK
jgi:hypothetical protein